MDLIDLMEQRIKLKGVLLELKREVCYDAFNESIRQQNILTIQASIKVLDDKIINFKECKRRRRLLLLLLLSME